MTARERQGPLDGLRVVDCSGMIAGGFATTQLADFGADVIKVEHPAGNDPLREWPPYDEGVSLWWNRRTTRASRSGGSPSPGTSAA